MPFAHSLNVDIGTRYSKFNLAGNTTNSKLAVEWRPIEDLLLRGTVSEVFRAPNISELFAGAASDAPTAQDPCTGYSGTGTTTGLDRACGSPPVRPTSIPTGGIAPQANGQLTGHRARVPWRRASTSCRKRQELRLRRGLRSELDRRPVGQRRLLPHLSEQYDHGHQRPERVQYLLSPIRPARSARSSRASRTAISTTSPSRPSTWVVWIPPATISASAIVCPSSTCSVTTSVASRLA